MAETFKNQVDALTGFASTEDDALSDWLTAGTKEIINALPLKLKEKCMTATGVGTDFKVDLDGLGEILYVTRKNADAGYYTQCRKIPSSEGGLATDSSNIIHYATATDPVYWIDGDTSGAATLYVKPTPTANQTAILHHIGYPIFVASGSGTLDFTAQSTIPNFPDEAEYLVVLYASCKVLQNKMSEMQASIVHSDQDGTYTAPTNLNLSTPTGSQGWEQVRHWIEREEDNELAQIQIAALSGELQQFVTEYQWYQGQQAKLQQDYDKGLAVLKGETPQQGGQ